MNEITYVYTTFENDYETIFREGICFFDPSYDINKILTRIYTEDELYDFLGKLDSREKAFIIRIPSTYMEVQRANSNYVLPYPMLYEKECMNPSSTEYNSYPVLVPSLIQMMYCGSVGCVPNPYYNQKYNPNGLKYTKTQLDSISKKMPGEYNRFKKRNNSGDCRELFDLDKASNIWHLTITVNKMDGVMTEPFAYQGELPDVRFAVKKKKKVKNLQKKKKRVKYYGDEEEY